MKFITICICMFLLGVFSPSSVIADTVSEEIMMVPGDDLLNYFSSSCQTQGQYVQAARSQTQALMNALNDIQQDSNCRTIAGTISREVPLLQETLLSLDTLSRDKVLLEELKAEQEQILIQIASTQDPGTIIFLEDSLSRIQVDIARQTATQKAYLNSSQENKRQLLTQAVVSANVLLTQALSNRECMDKQSSLLSGVVSVAGSVSAGATLFDPALSLGLSATTQIFGLVMDAFRNKKFGRAMKNVAKPNMGSAFQCVLESMSNQYCDACLLYTSDAADE